MKDEIPQEFLDDPRGYAGNELAKRKVKQADEDLRHHKRIDDLWRAWVVKAEKMLEWAKVAGLSDFEDVMYGE